MKCPACAESIPADSETCPFCQSDVAGQERPTGGRSKAKEARGKHGGAGMGMGIAVVLGITCVGLLLCAGVLVALLLPALQAARGAAQRAQCSNNMRQIALALHMYQDANKSFPPAVTRGPLGEPMHSWRVLILPYLGEDVLYGMYRMDEPWDSPNNIRLQGLMPAVYRCPSGSGAAGSGVTSYLGLSGPDTVFSSQGPVSGSRISDGESLTLLFVEAEGANIPWTQPKDIDVSQGFVTGPGGAHSGHPSGFNVALADGSVQFLPSSTSPQKLQSMSTANGRD